MTCAAFAVVGFVLGYIVHVAVEALNWAKHDDECSSCPWSNGSRNDS